MKYRKLGHGLEVSAIGIGCMPMIKGGNILYGEAAAERDVLPEIQYDPLVEQPAVEPFRAADIADGDQRHLIFDIHYLFWFLTGVSLAARAITW